MGLGSAALAVAVDHARQVIEPLDERVDPGDQRVGGGGDSARASQWPRYPSTAPLGRFGCNHLGLECRQALRQALTLLDRLRGERGGAPAEDLCVCGLELLKTRHSLGSAAVVIGVIVASQAPICAPELLIVSVGGELQRRVRVSGWVATEIRR